MHDFEEAESAYRLGQQVARHINLSKFAAGIVALDAFAKSTKAGGGVPRAFMRGYLSGRTIRKKKQISSRSVKES